MSLSAEVAADPRRIAASSLPTGEDNAVAIDIGNLLYKPVSAAGSISDMYSGLVYAIGTDAANAETAWQEHAALANQLELRRQSISGVSIDEETVQIMQFQRAYEASARLIRTVDELTQMLLTLGE
jgi:flagellar hook-associated protein 1 FlgK